MIDLNFFFFSLDDDLEMDVTEENNLEKKKDDESNSPSNGKEDHWAEFIAFLVSEKYDLQNFCDFFQRSLSS